MSETKRPEGALSPASGYATVRDGKFFIGETMYEPDDLLHLELIAEHMTTLWNCGLIAEENCEGWRKRALATEAEVKRLHGFLAAFPPKSHNVKLNDGAKPGEVGHECTPEAPFIAATGYAQPTFVQVELGLLGDSISCLEACLDDTKISLIVHDRELGRTTRKNQWWAETLEGAIRKAEETILKLKALHPEHNEKLSDGGTK